MKERLSRFLAWRWAPWCVAAGLFLFAFAVSWVWVEASADTLYRYSIMADAFAEGNWREAFHPRFGVGFSMLSGALTWLLGCNGFYGCVWVALAVWAITVVPLFDIAQRIFDRTTAWVTTLMYAICPYFFQLSLGGMRDAFRLLGTLLLVLAILQRRNGESKPSLLPLLLATPMMCTMRSDMLLGGAVLLLVYGCYDRFRARFWIGVLWFIVWCQPGCWLSWEWFHVWLPSKQIVSVWLRLMGGLS